MTRQNHLINLVDHALRTEQDVAGARCFCARHFASPAGQALTFNDWDATRAIKALGLHLLPYNHIFTAPIDVVLSALEGTCTGYTLPSGGIWLHPATPHRLHAAIHELAHQTLGHLAIRKKPTKAEYNDAECEAELTLILVFDALGLPEGFEAGITYMREYGGTAGVPERHRNRAIQAAARIVAAGRASGAGLANAA